MPPYAPPSAHYSQMDVSDVAVSDVFAFIGRGGRFYYLTRALQLDYLWFDPQRRVIEIWGAPRVHENHQSEHVIRCELENYLNNKRVGDVKDGIQTE